MIDLADFKNINRQMQGIKVSIREPAKTQSYPIIRIYLSHKVLQNLGWDAGRTRVTLKYDPETNEALILKSPDGWRFSRNKSTRAAQIQIRMHEGIMPGDFGIKEVKYTAGVDFVRFIWPWHKDQKLSEWSPGEDSKNGSSQIAVRLTPKAIQTCIVALQEYREGKEKQESANITRTINSLNRKLQK